MGWYRGRGLWSLILLLALAVAAAVATQVNGPQPVHAEEGLGARYDNNNSGLIDRDEVFAAIFNYFDGTLSQDAVLTLIGLFVSKVPVAPPPEPTPTAREAAVERIAEIIGGRSPGYLVDLWLLDAELGVAAARQPCVTAWEQEGNREEACRFVIRSLKDDLPEIASADVELAKLTVSVPWFLDGLTYHELILIRKLGGVATEDLELARLIVSFPWFADGSFDGPEASSAVGVLGDLASTDVELARHAAGLLLADGVPHRRANPLGHLDDLATTEIELARRAADFPWLADEVTEAEAVTMRLLAKLAASDIDLARGVSEQSWLEDEGEFAGPVLGSLSSLADNHADYLGLLIGQPWFADGLNREEAAFVTTLGWAIRRGPELYTDLLQTRYTQHRAVSLPMAGEVNIWIIQNTPFPPGEDLLTVIEDTARFSEQFMGVPFPKTDIILLIVENVGEGYGIYSAKHLASFMLAVRRSDGVRSVRHETAHYYTTVGLHWLSEGWAEFLVAYVRDRTGVQSMADRMIEVSQEVQRQCLELNEIENIRHYVYLRRSEDHTCPYAMGENLLLNVYEQFGEGALAATLSELHFRRVTTGGERTSEIAVFETFAKHIPPERQEEFLSLYRRLHGGPPEDPAADLSDDHGDEASAATEIVEGDIVEGSLDYQWDFDYFRLPVQEGQVYEAIVTHEALRPSSINVYASDGQTSLVRLFRDSIPAGPRLLWEAVGSDEHYFAVHNFGGKSGPYTLTINRLVTIPDDHGDTPLTATDISVNDVVSGSIDHPDDIDIFRYEAVEGRRYWASLKFGTLTHGGLMAFVPAHASRGKPVATISSPARISGSRFYIVIGLDGAVGTYTLHTGGETASVE